MDRPHSASRDEGLRRTLHDVLSGAPDDDPLNRLLDKEDRLDWHSVMIGTFSQFAAYVILLVRSTWDVGMAAHAAGTSVATFRKRLIVAHEHSARQPSMFDGMASVDVNFVTRAHWFRCLRQKWDLRKTRFLFWMSRGKRVSRSRAIG